ncbi:MAG: hypothetical protein NZ957_05180 [Thaumarchaeota archaeon]|nr:hypothetical protein [Candidatus Calditenuaceae archaeon]
MKVGIIGVGFSEMKSYEPSKAPAFQELPFIAVKRALQNAGVERGEVDFFVESSYDFLDGRMISNMYTCTNVGAFLRSESRVADDSLLGVAYAAAKIKSGDAEIAVVESHGIREVDHNAISHIIFDPFVYRNIGMSYLTSLALVSKAYIDRYRVDEDDALTIVSKNRRAGYFNPNAHLREPINDEEVRRSPYVVYPLRQSMLAPPTSGSVALVLANEYMATRLVDQPVWIESISWCTDSYYLGGKPLHTIIPLQVAAKKAYTEAGITNPAKQIGLFEVCDVTPYHELMAYEALGLAQEGKGCNYAREGVTDPREGSIPVNVSGGSLSTDPYPASSLFKLVEAYLQMRGEAVGRQIKGVERALVHGFSYIGGASAQTHVVLIAGV